MDTLVALRNILITLKKADIKLSPRAFTYYRPNDLSAVPVHGLFAELDGFDDVHGFIPAGGWGFDPRPYHALVEQHRKESGRYLVADQAADSARRSPAARRKLCGDHHR